MNGSSNHNDSEVFDSAIAAVEGATRRGKGRRYVDGTNGNLAAVPWPESAVTLKYVQSAGVQFIQVEAAPGRSSDLRSIQDQADVFYFSGHGNHLTGGLLSSEVTPTTIGQNWKRDLDKVFIAGCSVLDINDYNNHYNGADHTASPGKAWATTGPKLLFGYNWVAPLDNNLGNANFTAEIAAAYVNSAEADEIKRWMYANRDAATTTDPANPGQRPWNACVIDMRAGGVYWYWNSNSLDGQGKPTLTSVPMSQW